MAQNDTARYLVTYDIADPRRLGRLYRFLKKEGVPIQYSVFLVESTANQMGSLMVKIAKMIHPQADDVRSYRLPENGWQVTLGTSILPDDVLPGGLAHQQQTQDQGYLSTT